ncbi:YtzH-like family protein [Scopulibacillus darangshiensis]|uniref:YtzH-like family protein n=1 Tax=Scopulibacillus darangshiensis TaxID=442528 RepID=UPI00104E5318|nr:YtzH-like family protein [Scopulibacillus darangshiensis]
MVLSHQHQMNLIRDIINSHQSDGTARLAEFEQLYRSANSLITQQQANHQLNQTLQSISSYSEQAMNLNTYDGHLQNNKNNFQGWLDTLQ